MTATTHRPQTTAPKHGQRGELVGRYRLTSLLGTGGFGEVWRAEEEVGGQQLNSACAVKLVPINAAEEREVYGSDQLGGWVDEVRALRSVSCNSIPRIYWADHLPDRKLAYIAMELLEGETLAEHMRARDDAIPWRRALAIAAAISYALDTAHQLDHPVIHCDLKPHNVILSKDGRVCVIDWGIAQLQRGLSAPTSTIRATTAAAGRSASGPSTTSPFEPSEEDDSGTVTFGVMEPMPASDPLLAGSWIRRAGGTPGYIAPEVYGGGEPTPAADRYALGVVLYQMIAGRLPYPVSTATTSSSSGGRSSSQQYRKALLAATIQGDIEPLDKVVPGVPRGVAALVAQLLAHQPELRGDGKLADEVAHASRFPHGVPEPPYAGLESFDATRAGLLFGRRAHVDALVERLRHNRALLLRGPSGCGKSSLAVAGVAARIDALMLDGTDGWNTVVIRPSVPDALAPSATDERRRPQSLGTVVVVDQLEEILGLPDAQRASFASALKALATGQAPVRVVGQTITTADKVRVIATVRDDLEWKVMDVGELRQLFDRHREYVVGIDAGAARELVEEPARAAGARVENVDAVAGEVREQLSKQATMLPMVQFALTEWWRRRHPVNGRLTTSAWHAIGGVEGALAFVADRYHDALKPKEREALRAIFQRLFRGDRKIALPHSEVRDPVWRKVLHGLLEHRLVRLVKRDERSPEPADAELVPSRDPGADAWYEAVHEALALRWQPLQAWLRETAADDALIDELVLGEELWRRRGSPAEVALAGHKIERAKAFLDRLDGRTRMYVEAAAEHAHKRELLLKREARWQRRRRRMMVAAVIAVLAAAASIYIVVIRGQQREAEEALRREEIAKTGADKARAEADRQRQKAEAQTDKAEHAAEVAQRAERKAADEREKFKTALGKLTGQVDDAIRRNNLAALRRARQEVSDESVKTPVAPRRPAPPPTVVNDIGTFGPDD